MDAKSIIARYYTKLRIAPATLRSSVAMYLVIAFLILTTHALSASVYTIYIDAIFLTAFVCILMRVPFLDLRRAINFAFFALIPVLPLEIIASLLGFPEVYIPASLVTTTIVLRGIVSSLSIPLAIATLCGLTSFIYGYLVEHNLVLTLCRIALVVLSLSLSALVLKVLRHAGSRHDVDVIEIANAWSKFVLVNDGKDLEKIFDKHGREEDVKIYVLRFVAQNDDIALLVPGVHFGPFRSLGSSTLPYVVAELLSRNGVKALVLHGPGSHELNVTTSVRATDFAKEVVREIVSNTSCREEQLMKPFRVFDEEGREIFVIPLTSSALLLYMDAVRGGDDLPKEVSELANTIGRVYGYNDVAVVDCHNLEGPRLLDLAVYERMLRRALSIRSRECENVRVGYGEARCSVPVRGLCSDIVKAVVIECDGEAHGIIYLFGNNAEPGVRETLRRLCFEHGLRDCEVLTVDDHTCSATTFDAPYYAVALSPYLVRAVDRALAEAIKNLRPAKAYVCVFDKRVKVVGPKIFDLLRLVEILAPKFAKVMLVSYVLLYALSITVAVLRAIHLI